MCTPSCKPCAPQARTEWLDQGTEAFLSSPSCADGKPCQVVVIGAGFDTRSIRYQREGLRFFEVDLPETIDAKRCVHERYRDDVNPQVNLPTLVGMDLNDCEHSSLLARLEEGYGFERAVPTLFISEAVLFYVNPLAIKNYFDEIFAFGQQAEAMCARTPLAPLSHLSHPSHPPHRSRTDPTPILHRSRTDLAPILHPSCTHRTHRTDLAPISRRSRCPSVE